MLLSLYTAPGYDYIELNQYVRKYRKWVQNLESETLYDTRDTFMSAQYGTRVCGGLSAWTDGRTVWLAT